MRIISIIALLFCLPALGQQPQWASLMDIVEAALDEDNPEVSKQVYFISAVQQIGSR